MPALELARTRPKTVELLLRSARLPAAARGLLCSHATAFIKGSCAPHNNTLTNSITRTRYTDLYLDPLPIRLVLSHITTTHATGVSASCEQEVLTLRLRDGKIC